MCELVVWYCEVKLFGCIECVFVEIDCCGGVCID